MCSTLAGVDAPVIVTVIANTASAIANAWSALLGRGLLEQVVDEGAASVSDLIWHGRRRASGL